MEKGALETGDVGPVPLQLICTLLVKLQKYK